MQEGREIISNQKFDIVVRRLCYQLIENYQDFSNACIIGLQPRGTILSKLIYNLLTHEFGVKEIEYGDLDITFYRDDYRDRTKVLHASETRMNFIVEQKRVLLIDDVLYTGRSIHAAMSAIQHYGRPSSIELLSFIDRRFNRDFPIQSNYTGLVVDALDEAYVILQWNQEKTSSSVNIYPNKSDKQ
ncbi:MAG: bifunctional pyr operon transcriptional regulator/uracil phosphoribosyltransferase PyrR [Saprospiraceae bacterium]|jgi:pyrimidine operon attenuation protein/uracil phosphoribosyltransferase|nr:bifunctional pyr operon transcriptional regulator/uracil phosphoribosyltransferase PyrR [Saprospiraceae bacterium]MCO5277126.1 bifunctional pyr operon transcriptional regulator/uracil phosphoribosyltransferase PyrR [Saprospiraceae bacterium]